MLLFIVVTTLALAAIRLYGITENWFKTTAHLFSGFLLGYICGDQNWIVVTSFVILVATEVYAFIISKFPAIGLASLVKDVEVKL